MRPHLSVLAVLFAWCGLAAQRDHRIERVTGLDQVTVYLNGGEVRTRTQLDLANGRNVVLLKGLSPHTHAPSVQVSINGDLQILSVNTAGNFLDPGKLEPRITLLKDSVDLLNDRIAELDDRIAASEAEKEMLGRNHDIGGDGVVVSADQLAKAADFFRERTLVVNKAISRLKKERTSLQEQLVRAQLQLDELNYRHDPSRKDVTIVLMAAKAQKVDCDLRYLVANTGWAPIYDLVAKDNATPITLRYKAQVYNNTGVDWNGVKLILSTADPSLGARKPELERWALNYNNDRYWAYQNRAKDKPLAYDQEQALVAPNQVLENDARQTYQVIAVSEVSAEFAIARPYDIPNDAKPYLVDIAEHSLNATYGYMAVPKLDRDAFLLARITGWQKLNIVDGKANVYFGDGYVGESFISTVDAEDTLDLSLGRDRTVQLDRRLKEEMTSTKAIGSDRKETSTYEITVRNNGKAAVTIDVLDQLPVSQDSQIKVNALETSGAEVNMEEGLVTWRATLPPGGVEKYTFSYSIQYPKNRPPATKKRFRTVAAPSF